jgi:hypothetical protein
MKRFQVDIKPNHQPFVRQLMKKLGDVSSADAIGFLVETQISAALARLDPAFGVTQSAWKSLSQHQVPPSSRVAHHRQTPAVSHSCPQSEAADALDALLGA